HTARVPPGPPLSVTLPFTRPLHPDNLFGHLVATAVPGVEEWRDGAYRCTLRLPGGPGVAALRPPAPASAAVLCTLRLSDPPDGALTPLFPAPVVLAGADPSALAMPAARRETVLRLARALADGSVDLSPGADAGTALAALAALPGIGPWTVGTVAMRALGDRD